MTSKNTVRLLTLGESGAGKSSLLLRYTLDEFSLEYMPTIGIDFRLKTVEINGEPIKVQVWDTAGQERFRTITHNYYRGAHGIALVYDISSEQSFLGITSWVQSVKAFADSSVTMVLIGNKCDLISQRAVSTEAGQNLADEYGIPFFEASAKMDICVHDAFNFLVQDVYTRLFGEGVADQKASRNSNQVDLNSHKQKPSQSRPCC